VATQTSARYQGRYYDGRALIRLAAKQKPIRVPLAEYAYVLQGGDDARRVAKEQQHQRRTTAAQLD